MKTILIFFTLFFIPYLTFSQNDETIKNIRNRYYRITSKDVILNKVSYEETDYYLEGNQLSVSKVHTYEGLYEYYYHYKKGEYHPYFIFFNPKDKSTPQLRAYYNDTADIILLKEGDTEKCINNLGDNPYKYLKQDAYNAINQFFNITVLAMHPDQKEIKNVFEKVKMLESSIVSYDTISNQMGEYDSSYEIAYFDENKKKVKSSSAYSSEHYGGVQKEYFYKGNIIYSVSDEVTWIGQLFRAKVYATFYTEGRSFSNGKPFRTDFFECEWQGRVFTQANEKYLADWNMFNNVIPRIEYHKVN
ncbi:hypothetical protein [Flammeovirga kamogawensis]|uniref:Uncharacterized protein n=1 Tax=Flammeovirga kamogawensis TaxID=373891 RepID=A0ABX8H323_9BACT|nr:hypothetical protein [Flammeovirga kamogawensis]MBB6460515.1 hypothetical protein [Flammeovirga kamogawensis]QWG10321.1 hypothetical protein KM029_21800 [Flammeovirga kamogawensis]TRX64767.1 hypothetical protein EO216_19710 [Flammeovirga kamogawensis]